MAHRRILYLTVLIAGCVFFWAYREWLSWLLLVVILGTPWLSLALSLPAMLLCRANVQLPSHLEIGQEAYAVFQGLCAIPVPALGGKLTVSSNFSSDRWTLVNQESIPTEHCGTLYITPSRVYVYDYLGLFRLRVRNPAHATVLVRPVPVAVENPPDMSRYTASAWVPKPGGGYAENHELRLYRPGDNLRQLHWKLTAKTGKLIVREPMEAMGTGAVLTVVLNGGPDRLDQKLGHLLFMSQHLLKSQIPHCICCQTGNGVERFLISSEAALLSAVDVLLGCPLASDDSPRPDARALWRYHIGGDGHES